MLESSREESMANNLTEEKRRLTLKRRDDVIFRLSHISCDTLEQLARVLRDEADAIESEEDNEVTRAMDEEYEQLTGVRSMTEL